MPVQRALPKSRFFLSFSLFILACGNVPAPSAPADRTGVTVPSPALPAERKLAPADPVAPGQPLDSAAASVPLPSHRQSDRTLAPYFFIDGEKSAAELLPLKSTRAEVQITGAMAEVQVTQVYQNRGRQPIEAVYLFPAATRAAVHAMKMTLGQRVIEAQIRERGTARRDYAAARAQGRTASLLEQQRPNVFQMHVANILPGDELKVELRYAELLVPENHVYEFVYPTTVGPRYSNKPESQATPQDTFVKTPILPAGATARHTFALNAVIQSAVPIHAIEAPNHATAKIIHTQPATAQIVLPEGDDLGNRDFVVRYALEDPTIEGGLLLEPGEKENHFLFMMQPPARIESRAIVPREYIFVVDVSGSMNGFPLGVAKNLMQNLFSGLRAQDKFNILSFSGASALLAPSSLPATANNLKQATKYLKSWESGGGTELLPALRQVLALPRDPGRSRIIVVITDGYVNVETETFALVRDSLGDANLFAFGIGSSVNRFLIEGMARAGQGEPFIVLNEKEAQDKATDFQSYIRAPVLQGVRVRFEGFDAYDVEPIAVPDLFAEKPIVVQGKYRGAAHGTVVVTGHAATGDFAQTLDVAAATRSAQTAVLSTLWARTRIERLADLDRASHPTHEKEITELGLAHHLLTDYTSFVAIDSAVRAEGQKVATVEQPSPLPAGVSNLAVSQAHSSGVLGILGSGASVFGRDSGTGREADSVMGGLVGTEAGDAYGAGGLGLVGVGRGGGTGEGTIGLGNLGTIGGGIYGKHTGSAPGGRGGRPEVVGGAAEVRGSIDAEVIRRIIRRHLNEVKFCYERELVRNPQLQGRVILQFTIGATGAVLSSLVQSSTLGVPAVEQCIASAVRRWEFPKPQGQVAVVVYPFVLKPSS